MANPNDAVMKKTIISSLVLLTLFSGRPAFGADASYDDEEDDLFNRGKVVSKESNEYERARRRTRFKNWGLAFTTTALGVATLVVVSNQHNK